MAIGKDLQQSIEMSRAARTRRQQSDAWELAELATRKLAYMLDAYVAVRSLVESACNAVDEERGGGRLTTIGRRPTDVINGAVAGVYPPPGNGWTQ